MAETTADVRRDIELTRERMSTTLQQLEQKLNVMQVVRDNPWPALALFFMSRGMALLSPKRLAPEQTVATLKEDTAWLKQQLTSGATSR